MVTKTPEITDRKPRADAARNRERILEVAKEEFTRVGANASLEEIAKKAAVGPGTLYRHFPSREELLVAVYRSEMEKLAAAERTLADSKSPVEALRAWLLLFVDAVETKHIIAPVLNTLVGDPKKVFETSYAHRIIQTSSSAAASYGIDNPNERVFTEEDWSNPNHPDNAPYTRSKTLAERTAWDE
jgi:AcrR family transcriptional regulator